MAQENLDFNINVKTNGAEGSIGSLKKQLREAQNEVVSLSDKFGATSKQAIEAAKRAGELRDKIGDAKSLTDAFNPDAKFKALTASLSGVAGGFGAVQGAMALFGAESDNVQKTLLKVQSAMAISQGLQSVGESIDSFRQLGAVIKSTSAYQAIYNFIMGDAVEVAQEAVVSIEAETVALNSEAAATVAVTTATTGATIAMRIFRAALIATGIGAVVVLVGLLIEAFSSLTSSTKEAKDAQDKLNKSIETQNEILDSNILLIKRAGDLRISELKKNGATEAQIYNEQRTNDLLLLDEYLGNYRKKYAIWEKDKKENAKSNDKEILANSEKFRKESIEASNQYENQKLKIQIDANAEQERIRQLAIQKGKEYADKLKQIRQQELKELENGQKEVMLKLLSEREQEEFKVNEHYSSLLFLATKYKQDTTQIKIQQAKELKQIDEKYKKEEAERNEASIKANVDFEIKLADDLRKLAEKNADEERELKFQRIENLISDLDYENNLIENDYKADQERLIQKSELLKEERDIELSNIALTAKERIDIISKYAKAERDIDAGITASKKAEQEAQVQIQMQYIDFVQQAGSLLGQIAGQSKGIAITGILLEKGAALAKVIMSTATANAAALATPQAILTSGASAIPVIARNNIQGALSSAAIIAGAIQGIQQINSAGAGGNGGGGMPSMSSQAPMTPQTPQAQVTQLNQQSINDIGNQAVRAYVIESDVTSNQQRIAAIRQRARFS